MSRVVITLLVAIHFLIAAWHGGAHSDLAVVLSAGQNGFVYLVIIIAPLVSMALVWTRYWPVGVWLFALSMLGGFLFGAYHHYVLVSPDNIHHLPAGAAVVHAKFIDSAGALALVELAATLYGAFCLGTLRPRTKAKG